VSSRDILNIGDPRRDRKSHTWVYESGGQVTFDLYSVFDWLNEEIDSVRTSVDSAHYLESMARARLGDSVKIDCDGYENSIKIYGNTFSVSNNGVGVDFGIIIDFDRMFLDSFSVIENSEPRLRRGRDVFLGPVERVLLQSIKENISLLQNFSPREFEVFIGALLANSGFYNIYLSRFVKDGGYDLYAVCCEGEEEYTVVVEVKHYSSKRVGIEIVDRLNGVRDRLRADGAVIFTTSSFTAAAVKEYQTSSSRVGLVDYSRLKEKVCSSENWTCTTSDMWQLPRR